MARPRTRRRTVGQAVAALGLILFSAAAGSAGLRAGPAGVSAAAGLRANLGSTIGVQCNNDPVSDTAALLGAIGLAETNGDVVSIGPGTCALNARLPISRALTMEGAGASLTDLVEHANTNILQITADGVTIAAVNLDNATYNATAPVPKHPNPAALYSNANNTTIQDVSAEAGSGFGMRIVGPQPCATDQRGGSTLTGVDITTTGTGGFASIDLSCQNGASVSNVTIHGGTLALYQDQNVTVSGENFAAGPLAKQCAPAWNITGPANNISIDSLISSAGGGLVHKTVTGLSVTNQTLTNPNCTARYSGV